MATDLTRALRMAAERTVEDLAFLIVTPEVEVTGTPAHVARARVRFDGPLSGHIACRVTAPVLDALSTNMLALEGPSSLTNRQKLDALGELTNVVCGNALPLLAGPRAEFHVTGFEASMLDATEDTAGEPLPDATVTIALREGCAEISLILTGNGTTS